MNLKNKQMKLNTLSIIVSIFFLLSCSSDDNNDNQNTIANVEFEVVITNNGDFGPDAIITTQINNISEEQAVGSFPFSRTYSEVEASEGNILILNYEDDSDCASGVNCDYSIRMRIYVDKEIVEEQSATFAGSVSSANISYTF
ncbi:MAG: hypothetical protein CMH15_12885 [Mesonia sp.]|nr:hypothetical protein [Mesonia sp.]MAQ41918.1 hypothetical protein [Mesonia sp.]MBJ98961.1 hypothetical protein [Flavobacteriaceae bacterium]|tara:strand:+ start:1104 stop:1532 length:429 start_codon:yes stop_codon:yes gene_type:complete